MLINALCKYADENLTDIIDGYIKTKIDYRLVISYDGQLIDIIPTNKEDETDFVYYPKQIGHSGTGIHSAILETTAKYVLGVEKKKKNIVVATNNNGEHFHSNYVNTHIDFFNNFTISDSNINCIAFKKFINNWNPLNELNNPLIIKLGKALESNIKVGISVDTFENYLEEDEEFIKIYTDYINKTSNNTINNNSLKIIDAMDGSVGYVANLHTAVVINHKSVPIISVNNFSSSESYGNYNNQAKNAYITERTMQKYVNILNELLHNDNTYTEEAESTYLHFVVHKNVEDSALRDKDVSDVVNKIFKKEYIDINTLNEIKASEVDDFYIFELTPNPLAEYSRVSIKNQYHNTFGNLISNVNDFQNRFRINIDGGNRDIKIPTIIKASLPNHLIINIDNKKVKLYEQNEYKTYYSKLVNTIINGAQIPFNIFRSAVTEYIQALRFYSESTPHCSVEHKLKIPNNIQNNRLRIMKAYINYKYNKEVIDMDMKTTEFNLPYMLGELFALYEFQQCKAMGFKINNTIRDRFYALALKYPCKVLVSLDKNSQKYNKKIRHIEARKEINKQITERMSKLGITSYPNKLSIEEQSLFIFGYHTKWKELNDMFPKLQKKTESDDVVEDSETTISTETI